MKTGIIKWYDAERECEFVFAQVGENISDDNLAISGSDFTENLLDGRQPQFDVIDRSK